MNAADCAYCGEPLTYAGRGRRPVVHAGACARLRANEVDEDRREARYREALRDAAVRAPLPDVSHVDTEGDDGAGFLTRLGEAGFAPLYDDANEDVPKREKARTAHRRAVLAGLAATFAEERRKTNPAKRFAREHDVADCYGCPVFDHLAVVAVVSPEGLLRAREEAKQDQRVRRHLDEHGLAALMARPPA